VHPTERRAPSIPEAWYSTKSAPSFAAFLAQSDVLLLALPSTPGTRHILAAATLSLLPPHALVVNIGRGDAVDTTALLAALEARRLGGAALDVAEAEPLPAGHPLFGRRDVIVTPHLSGRTVVYYERATRLLLENVRRWERGEEVWNKVDFQKGY
jgi:phosphoglycerate dehydrogenase-like enzyme